MFLIAGIIMGPYFVFDNCAALEEDIENKIGVDQIKYSLLYTFYAWPNIFLPFFSGYFISKIG